jgi:hypothetical protein
VQFDCRLHEPVDLGLCGVGEFLRLDMAISDGLRIAALGDYS